MSTTLSSCLKSYYRIFGTAATTVTSGVARNLFAEANFAQRNSQGTNITYDTVNNQIVFGNTGTRYFEVLFVGGIGASTGSQNGTVSIVIDGVTQKLARGFSTGNTNVARQLTLYGIFACTNGTTLQINYVGGTNVYVIGGSSVIVRFIS